MHRVLRAGPKWLARTREADWLGLLLWLGWGFWVGTPTGGDSEEPGWFESPSGAKGGTLGLPVSLPRHEASKLFAVKYQNRVNSITNVIHTITNMFFNVTTQIFLPSPLSLSLFSF